MSHFKERIEKNCLNCNAQVAGRFCQTCGQENIEPKETFWHLITHFFNDITHFDGKFFTTLGLLIKKPGFLSREYLRGRRADYLNPIRMYVFTSAIFFLVFFNMTHLDGKVKHETKGSRMKQWEEMSDARFRKEVYLLFSDSTLTREGAWQRMLENEKKPITSEIRFYPNSFKTISGYDSFQQRLSKKQKDGWWKRNVIRKQIHLNEMFQQNPVDFVAKIFNGFIHTFPPMLFVSLPLFALILQLVYRRRKELYYVDHGMFTIHWYIFTFIVILFGLILSWAIELSGWAWLIWINHLVILYLFFYMYKAMRNFYGQRRAKTILKFIIVNFLSFLMFIILGIFFFLFTSITI